MENGRAKKQVFLAITVSVIVFLNSASFALAAKTKINDEQVERVKIALSIVQTASDIGGIFVDGGNFKTILNTVIRGSETATDVTYGLLVLSAINEMEFMDMVLSQSYKDEARDYFNKILDERINLRSYWKGVGFDIPKVASGRITSPMSALALNTFEITDKTILIITAFNVLQKEKQYDGLWYYFDLRKNSNEPHEVAWQEAEEIMGWAAKPNPYAPQRLTKNNYPQLEPQFLALYSKWSPYATPYGISKTYKEQLASELRDTLIAAAEENTGVQPRYVEEPSLWDKLTAQLASIKDALAKIVSQVKNPFSAGPIIITEPPEEVIPADNGSPQANPDVGRRDAEPLVPAEARPPQAVPAEISAEDEHPRADEWAEVGSPPISEPAEMIDVQHPSLATQLLSQFKHQHQNRLRL